ncbi:hypothetical protein RvY_01659 [Ramazzottius varieornatus]|uniref:Nucleoside diphosphate-linked moiety X motif 6 n=1 Tax=Ramazzottius varieornatus TaxID=947166 RepID=A0A1D1UH56_RAMVA|nr:hypothetical protein RvY_01659 [Ramazzottius varieornatus]
MSNLTRRLARAFIRSQVRYSPVFRNHCSPRYMSSQAKTFNFSPANRFGSVRLDVKDDSRYLSESSQELFAKELCDEIARCKADGIRGMWLYLPISTLALVPICLAQGFSLHHCRDGYLLMNMWLLDSAVPSTMPKYTTHTVGVAGCVIDEEASKLLMIRDTTNPSIWKFPGGFSDFREDIQKTAQREVLEETGIETEFRSVLAFRQHHDMVASFGMSDIYVVCRMQPKTKEIRPCATEIVECRWHSLDDLFDPAFTATPFVRRILSLVERGLNNGFEDVDIKAQQLDSIMAGKTYNVFHR